MNEKEVGAQFHVPADLPPSKRTHVLIVGPQTGLGVVAKRKILLCLESKPGRPCAIIGV